MTVEQFFELPEPVGDFTYELHFGEIIQVGRPKKRHFDLQSVIRDILAATLDRSAWRIEIEMPYGLTAGYDARAADVGVASRSRWSTIPEEGYLIGSPELVVQVKSRSDRDLKMEQDALTHITHGALSVWLVKPERREIVVITGGSRRGYAPGERIELPAPLGGSFAVSELLSISSSLAGAV
jgi:Uma2 family endonuclease